MKDKNSGKTINFEEKGDNWFVICDESNEGTNTPEEFLSQEGFLFNFSATPSKEEIKTSIYDYGLQNYIRDGYGKEMFIMNENFSNTETNEINYDGFFQLIILLSCLKRAREKIKDENHLHNPLMMVLVNIVNPKKEKINSTLQNYIEKIFEITKLEDRFNDIKKEIKNEFNGKESWRTSKEITKEITEELDNLSYDDVIKDLFNLENRESFKSETTENFQYSIANNKEIILQTKSSSTPFLMIKIGDTLELKNFLEGKRIGKKNDLREISLNEIGKNDNKINIILGSQAFYEGWDTSRINIINFVHIGSNDANKFVPQAIGRGMRNSEIDTQDSKNNGKRKWTKKKKLIESLFIFEQGKDSIEKNLDITGETFYSSEDLKKIGIVSQYNGKIDEETKKRFPSHTLYSNFYKEGRKRRK